MKVRGVPISSGEEKLGPGGDIDIAFIAIPIPTYQAVLARAQQEGCLPATIFERALSQYLDVPKEPEVVKPPAYAAKPDIVVRRRRK